MIWRELAVILYFVMHSKRTHLLCVTQGGVSDQERKKMKKKGDRYSMQTSLIVAALKRMLPVGLNICAPGDQELIGLAKNRFSQVMCHYDSP